MENENNAPVWSHHWEPTIDPKTGKAPKSEAGRQRAHLARRAALLALLGWGGESEAEGGRCAYGTGELAEIVRERLGGLWVPLDPRA